MQKINSKHLSINYSNVTKISSFQWNRIVQLFMHNTRNNVQENKLQN